MSTQTAFSQASWIAAPKGGGKYVMTPAPYFRRSFRLTQPVRSARLAITALGLYECEINGTRVGDQVFAPGWTDYSKRVQYQVHEVGALLQAGENALGAILGDGWYCGYVGWVARQNYGDRPRLLVRLDVTFEDGTSLTLVTDGAWKTTTGPILESDLLRGESYDARLELGAWSAPGYDEAGWFPAVVVPDPGITFQLSAAPPVRRQEELPPLEAHVADPEKPWGGDHVADLGQNFTGRVRITLEAPAGTTITLKHAEILTAAGRPYYDNLRKARATDYYTCKGGGPETWEPRFTFHGFRYVEVLGLPPASPFKLTGIVLHSDTPPTGHFACSNPLLNQLQHNIQWGQKSNFLEVPTDCPQRDERLGWTGDAQVFIRTACFNMDVQGFFHKWMQDARDAQDESGWVPAVIPFKGVGAHDGGPAWSDATIICPWTIYLCYGDVPILEEHYASMQRYLEYLVGSSRDLIRSHPDLKTWAGYGDWLALDGSTSWEGITPKDLIGTAFLAHDAALMSRIARILGKPEDAARYDELREKVVQAFRRRFVTPEGLLVGATQTSYILALHFDLLPAESRPTAIAELVRHIEQSKFHLATGFVGTPYICQVLEDNGHLDVAYKLLEQETFPSWLFPVKNGATTIWERWDGWTPEKGFQDVGMNSFNHYAYGAIGAWMYRTVAGLELDPEEPGYRHIFFRPRPGGSITWAEAGLETRHGKTSIKWELQGDSLELMTVVPAGCKATLLPPPGFAAPQTEFPPGTYQVTLSRGAK